MMREFISERERVTSLIANQPGQHLVLVAYGPHHNIHFEWVFNEADIDSSRIVWARSMSDNKDEELLRYYPNRRAWTLYAGE